MIWIFLLVVLVAIFGVGTLLEVAFWTLLIMAVVVGLIVLGFARILVR